MCLKISSLEESSSSMISITGSSDFPISNVLALYSKFSFSKKEDLSKKLKELYVFVATKLMDKNKKNTFTYFITLLFFKQIRLMQNEINKKIEEKYLSLSSWSLR